MLLGTPFAIWSQPTQAMRGRRIDKVSFEELNH